MPSCCYWKIFYLEHFTHYLCHLLLLEDVLPGTFYSLLLAPSAAVARYFTLKILLIITCVSCCCWKIFYLGDFTHYYSCHLLLLEDLLPSTFYSLLIVLFVAVGRYFTLNIYSLLLVSSAAVGRSLTFNILLIINRLICCCWKIFCLEHFTHYYSCHLLLLEDILH